MHVSVSAYDDGDLLAECLQSVRDVLPDATIQVVDGRYESWPDGADNSTDDTPLVADTYADEYVRGGPYERERDKHVHRVELAPDDEWCLLMDADERLCAADVAGLDDATAYQPRLFNALTYGPRAVYWPRLFRPAWVESVNRWDAYRFSVPCERTDAVTIVHRHDLRSRDYREAKYERFDNEGRTGRYEDDFQTYLDDDWDATVHECPACGRDSLTRSQVTDGGPDGAWSYVEACVAEDSCYRTVETTAIGGWRYLPDAVGKGFAEDPNRLRLELLDAGCPFANVAVEVLVEQMQPVTHIWVEEELKEIREPELFA